MQKFDIYLENEYSNYKFNDFMENFVENFAEESFEFYKQWDMFPFIYSEKQVMSAVAPAIHKYTKNIWLEQPFKKVDSEEQRFLDIATINGNCIYLIELKHSWQHSDENCYSTTATEWETAIRQIKDLKFENLNEKFYFSDFNKYEVYKIALMILPTFTKKTNNNILNQSAKEYSKNIFEDYKSYEDEEYQSNFIGTIKLNNCEKYCHDTEKGKQFFPFVSFIGRINKIDKVNNNKRKDNE